MEIQPQYQNVGTLLTARLFRIPEYQRAYAWQSKQRRDLFNDIEKVYQSDSDSTHFMATIVGLRRGKRTIASDEFIEVEVVDGQQRLTTLTLLLKAINKCLVANDAKRASEIQSLLVKGDDLSLLILQTNHDSNHLFVDYLREGAVPSEKLIRTSADRNLMNAINECEVFVENWTAKPERTALDLYATIKNRLSVIFFEIADESLVYTVFEVLNSRGLDVTWFDKLKSLLMGIVFEHGDAGAKRGTVKEIHGLWAEIYGTIGLRQTLNQETVRFAGTLRVTDLPNRSLDEESAVGVLVEDCAKSAKKVVNCTKWILKVTQAEERLLSNHRLRAVTQIMQARLVAIAVLLRKFPETEEKAILRRWENVTYRIFGLDRRDARTKVGDYVRLAWNIANTKLSSDSILEQLKEIGEDYPIDTVVEKLRNSDCYQQWTEQLRYLFYRYDEHLAEKAGESLNESTWNKIWESEPSRSVEHIRPQSKGSHDPKTHAIFVHRLGNLMMLPPGMNSKLKDKDPKKKVSAYETCGLRLSIEVGKSLRTGKWDRSAVEKRENRLIKWASAEWQD